MSKVEEEGEEIAKKIAELGDAIKTAKSEKKPKEEWEGILNEMLEMKVKYKEVTGKDFGPPPKPKKKKSSQPQPQPQQQEASEKNKAKKAKKAAEKAAKEAKKAANRLERQRREQEKAAKAAGGSSNLFGDCPLIQSSQNTLSTSKSWTHIRELNPELKDQTILIRGHLHTTRLVGRGAFVLLRQDVHSIQGVCFESKKNDGIPPEMVKYIANLPVESVVDVEGVITIPDAPVEKATRSSIEVKITKFHCVSKADVKLPFVMEDAMRSDAEVAAFKESTTEESTTGESTGGGGGGVGQDLRLDHRWLDLRTPANQSIFRIQSTIASLFREYLSSHGFVEIHTPKLIGGASEGGSEVFTLDYFGQEACLAMSPQLHKQMAAACSGLGRVYEVGPVFRAENSNTSRHLCEFTGMDLEMVIGEHYDEVMHVLGDLFVFIFEGVKERCVLELDHVRAQHPFEDLKYLRHTLKISYAEGCKLLREAGVDQGDYDDLSTENEKKLGAIVKEKYDTDFFVMDKFPLSVRPFYTMPCPENPKLSNSYDFFIRGQEILSGAQRVHDPTLLEKRATEMNIPLDLIAGYVDSFRNGAMPHGGGGIGLERVVMLFLGLPNIRKCSLFPRDPKRISP